MRQSVFEGLFKNPAVLSILYTFPNRDRLIDAARKGDLKEVFTLLPDSEKSIEEITTDYSDIRQDALSVDENDFMKPQAAVGLFRTLAYAEETEEPTDERDQFLESVLLLQKMRSKARDPNTELPSLEERLDYLIQRKDAIAGIVNIGTDELGDDLKEVRDGSRTSDTKKLIKFRGIVRFIGASANFRELEHSYAYAVNKMRTGFDRVRSLFARGISPRAKAESILKEIASNENVSVLTGQNFEDQKATVKKLIKHQETSLIALIHSIHENERDIYRKKLMLWQNKLNNAQTAQELRFAVQDLSILAKNMQSAARSRKNFLLRLGYSFQDFLGKNSQS
jgi:vacuolar-type H+-ATPase subunit I/STV1